MNKANEMNYRKQLKEATRRQIKASGGLEAAAAVTRVGKSELSHYQSTNHATRFIPVDVLADLMKDSWSTDVLNVLASTANHVLAPVCPEGDNLTSDILTLAEKAAQVFRDFCSECNKPTVSPQTAERLDRDLGEVVAIAMHARIVARTAALRSGSDAWLRGPTRKKAAGNFV